MADLAQGFEIIATVIACGLDTETLIAEAAVNGDVGRAVAGHHVLQAGGLLDRVKGRRNSN